MTEINSRVEGDTLYLDITFIKQVLPPKYIEVVLGDTCNSSKRVVTSVS